MYRKCNSIITETFEHSEILDLPTEVPDMTTIGGRLKYYRLEANLLQEDLSLLSGIHVSTIKRFENNKITPDINTCKKIAAALDINTDLLYDDYLQFITSEYPNIIKAYRKTTNLTQQQLADILNTSKKTVSCWERKAQYPSKPMYEYIKQLINI